VEFFNLILETQLSSQEKADLVVFLRALYSRLAGLPPALVLRDENEVLRDKKDAVLTTSGLPESLNTFP
jgi:hypothetical protein